MTDPTLILTGRSIREKACRWIMAAPMNARVILKEPKRSVPQNDRMYAMLTDIAQHVLYHGQRLSVDDFKLLFLDALGREIRIAPNLENNGFVNLGRSSSKLSKSEMSAMIELMFAFGAERSVKFNVPAEPSSILFAEELETLSPVVPLASPSVPSPSLATEACEPSSVERICQ